MATTRLIPMHVNKGKTIAKCLKERTDYAENGEKTNDGELVSSYECDPQTCDREFLLAKRQYLQIRGKEHQGNIIAYQIRQSFKPGEITPEEANRVGYETAMRWTKGNHAFIVATHIDRAHIHNHIIYNSTSLGCDRKWRNFFFSTHALQKVSDIVCIEHGLSVVDARPYCERHKKQKNEYPLSLRDELRADIDEVLKSDPKTFEELLSGLQKKDYEIYRRKAIAFRKKGKKRFLRIDTLGTEYSEAALNRRIYGEAYAGEATAPKRDFSLILDIQEIIKKNKGANYERWAKRYNLKQTAKALCFIQERGIKTFSELSALTENITKCYKATSDSLQKMQTRLEEIAELKKQIVNYAKTRETYEAYKCSNYSNAFFESHREDLLLRKTAREYFNDHNITKLPKMKELSEEYSQILAEKRKKYSEYKTLRADMEDFQIAKQNLEGILNSDSQVDMNEQRSKSETLRI